MPWFVPILSETYWATEVNQVRVPGCAAVGCGYGYARRGAYRRPVLPTLFSTLRQPRYAALTALMLVVAGLCIGLGTWQIARFDYKHDANDALRANDHAATVAVTNLLPLVGGAQNVSTDAVEYRSVSATGTYDTSGQVLVRQRIVDGDTGYYVLTPLHTPEGVLLVIRGFIEADTVSNENVSIAAPPSGIVSITGRVHVGESRNDKASELPHGQVESINPAQQQARTGEQTFDGYIQLTAGQPGSTGLIAIPEPDLSNPAGGAVEPQHIAYVVQWYLFAALALAAPVAMARADVKRTERDIDEQNQQQKADDSLNEVAELSEDERRARKLADRYGKI